MRAGLLSECHGVPPAARPCWPSARHRPPSPWRGTGEGGGQLPEKQLQRFPPRGAGHLQSQRLRLDARAGVVAQCPGCSLPLRCPGLPQAPPRSPSLSQMQEEYAMVDRGRDLEADFEEEEGLEWEPESEEGAQGSGGRKGSVQEVGAVELEEETELEEEMEQEAEGYQRGGRRSTCSLDEWFEEELMAQLEEYGQLIQEVQFELETTRTEHSLAAGRLWEDADEGPAAQAQQLGAQAPPPVLGSWDGRPGGHRDPSLLTPPRLHRPASSHLSPFPLLAQEPSRLYNDR